MKHQLLLALLNETTLAMKAILPLTITWNIVATWHVSRSYFALGITVFLISLITAGVLLARCKLSNSNLLALCGRPQRNEVVSTARTVSISRAHYPQARQAGEEPSVRFHTLPSRTARQLPTSLLDRDEPIYDEPQLLTPALSIEARRANLEYTVPQFGNRPKRPKKGSTVHHYENLRAILGSNAHKITSSRYVPSTSDSPASQVKPVSNLTTETAVPEVSSQTQNPTRADCSQSKPDSLFAFGNAKRTRLFVTINGRTCVDLLDTGASVTVVSNKITKQLGLTPENPLWEQPITMADGSHATSYGDLFIQVRLHRNLEIGHTATVMNLAGYDLVLGTDFLSRLGRFHIDLKNGFLSCSGIDIPFIRQEDSVQDVVLLQTVRIPPRTRVIVPCAVLTPSDDSRLFEPDSNLTASNIVGARALVTPTMCSVPVQLMNATSAVITLHDNQTVAPTVR